jgi:cupin domain
MATLTRAESKNLTQPEETRTFPHGRLEVVNVGGTAIGRARFEPGWKWSQDVKPIAGTASCEASHLGYVISGEMTVVMDDGARMRMRPGEAFSIPPGHDAWIEGSEPCVVVDFVGFADYAKPK